MEVDVTIRVRFGRGAPEAEELTQLLEDTYEDAVVLTVEAEEA